MTGSVTILVTLFLAGAYLFAFKPYSFRDSTSHHQNALPVQHARIATNFLSY